MEHEPHVLEIDRSNSSSTIEGISRDFKCDVHHTQRTHYHVPVMSCLSGKGLLESCALVNNGLPNTNFLGTCSFMKIGSCGLTNSLSRL
jgi:hypothetical protein